MLQRKIPGSCRGKWGMHIWNVRYLEGFKWHNLLENVAALQKKKEQLEQQQTKAAIEFEKHKKRIHYLQRKWTDEGISREEQTKRIEGMLEKLSRDGNTY